MTAVSLFAFVPGWAVAQAGPQAVKEEVQATGLEDIIVTAQKRGENLQSVPVSITAVTAEAALARGVSTTADLQSITPGVTISHSGQAPAIFVRGIGTQNTTAGEESSNSVYVDGVYYSALPGALFSLSNIQRIEILKGPQGTLFGRNATGGLIHVITRDPSFTFGADASVGVANFGVLETQAHVTGPLGERVAGDLAFFRKTQDEGWGHNQTTGREVYKGDEFSLRGKLLWTPTETTTIQLAADYSDTDNSFTAASFVIEGTRGIGGQAYTGNFFDITSDLEPRTVSHSQGVSVKLQQDLSWARFTSISAYRETKTNVDVDQDRVSLRVIDALIRSTTDQVTQEFQIQSLADSKVNWIAGLFYFGGTARLEPLTLAGAANAAIGGYVDRFAVQDTTSLAAYGQITYPLTDRTNLTAGLRYTNDTRELDAYDVTGLSTPGRVNVIDNEAEFSKTTWRLAADHHFTDRVMAFASYSRGFKSGVFNLFAPTGPAVDPEVLDAYEVGLKSEFFDRHLRVNLSPFYYKYQNIQLLQAIPGGTRLLNAAEASVKGLDFEVVAAPSDGLMVNLGLSLLDGNYDKFPSAPGTFQNPASCTPTPGQLPGPRTGGNITCSIDASGNQMIRAPKVTASLGVTYEWSTGFGDWKANLSYYYSDSYPFEPDNRLQQPAYSLVNGQLAWTLPDDRFRVRLWGRNIGDEEYYVNLISSVGDVGTPAVPRTFGLSLDFKL